MPHLTPDPPLADAELRTSNATPRAPHPDDPRIGIAANAIGWELHRHDREVTDRGDGNEQITVTAEEAAAGRAAAERVVAHLDGYAAEHELTATGPTADQHARGQAALAIGWQHPTDTDLDDYRQWWWAELDRLATYIRDGSRP